MAVTGIGPGDSLVSSACQQIGNMVQTFTVITAGILIACNQIGGNSAGNHGRPLITLDEMIQLDEVPHQFQCSIKSVEHITCMISHNSGVVGNPVCGRIGIFDTVGHT